MEGTIVLGQLLSFKQFILKII